MSRRTTYRWIRLLPVWLGLGVSMACTEPEPTGAPSVASHVGEAHDDHGPEEADRGIVELSPEAAARSEIRTAPAAERVLAVQLSTTGQVDFSALG